MRAEFAQGECEHDFEKTGQNEKMRESLMVGEKGLSLQMKTNKNRIWLSNAWKH